MMIKSLRCLAACMLLFFSSQTLLKAQVRCGSMEAMEATFKRHPELRANFDNQTQVIQRHVQQRKALGNALRTEGTIVTVPVVFHIVLPDPSIVTDAQIQAQIQQLNTDYAALNPDSLKIPPAFKPLFANTQIQFKLAQRTPNDEPSTGIVRTVTTHTEFTITDNSLKYTSMGGDDAWDHTRFFNVWITNLAGNYLGYSTFPNGVAAEDGCAINVIGLPGGRYPYNKGRTLTHEAGHYFFLYHIWGDDNGACTGTDYIDDTPNQGNFTSGCPGTDSVVLDNCTDTIPGIMYENFMDYTDDACMVMFTRDQVTRMQTALNDYRSSLYTSNGGDPVVLYSLDAAAKSINNPLQRVCSSTFSPVITLRNKGSQTITSATIYASIDNGTPVVTSWTGSLTSLNDAIITLNAFNITQGTHILNVLVSKPNGTADQNTADDTITTAFQYYEPATPPVSESFEKSTFPPTGWDIVNPDQSYTWERVTGVGKTGSASVVIRNFNYTLTGQKDYLRLPTVNIANADSSFITFQVAAATKANPSSPSIAMDTLEVMVSKDCGTTFTSLYKKWGRSLVTDTVPVTTAFVPSGSQWRKDSVNLTPYIGAGPLVIAFVNTNEYQNNIYLDDINVYQVSISENLKKKGFMITPNPTTGVIAVQFYPNPGYVKAINIFDVAGQKVISQIINAGGSGSYYFDLAGYASGVYVVQVVLGDRVITRKVLKR